MESLWLEALLIFLLILVNGFFAGSEIAIIASRRSRLQHLKEQGKEQAEKVGRLRQEPDRFLATIQVGITVVGILSGGIGGAAAVEHLKPVLIQVMGSARIAEALAIVLVVGLISYVSLILGELVPKALALRFPESIAMAVVGPLEKLSRVSSIPVQFLSWSVRKVLQPFGLQPSREREPITEEEIRILLQEWGRSGVVDKSEQDLIHSVFEFADTTVKEVMVPRPKIQAVPVDISLEEMLQRIVESGYSRYPVYERDLDNIIGLLHQKDVLGPLLRKEPFEIRKLLRPAYFVPESKKISDLLKELQSRRAYMAIVINEYGNVEGLVTLEDLIEEIVGEIEDEYSSQDRKVARLENGSLVVDASVSIRDLVSQYRIDLPESEDYETLGGFMMARLQRIPRGGEIIRFGLYKLTIVDMEGRRIAWVKIEEEKWRKKKA